ncbi:MAG: radical SAM protein [Clostridia bacterium]|nr:radical SAM protein [Clostridia bacterium]
MPLRMAGVIRESIVDGPQLRFVVFVQGCPHHCPGCHNPESHDPAGGYESTTTRLWNAIKENPLLRGVTFSGGEPFLWGKELAELGRAAREAGLTVMTYTGFTYETLLEKAKTDESVHQLLTVTNYLVDGPFILAERDLNLKFRGSRNQRILDITCYPNSKNAVLMDFDHPTALRG